MFKGLVGIEERLSKDNVGSIMSEENIMNLTMKLLGNPQKALYIKEVVEYINDEMDIVMGLINDCNAAEKEDMLNEMDKLGKVLNNVCGNNNTQIVECDIKEILKRICGEGKYKVEEIDYNDTGKIVSDMYRLSRDMDKTTTFTMNINRSNINAKGTLNEDGTFTVLKGSRMTAFSCRSYVDQHIKNIEMLKDKIRRCSESSYIFTEDYTFSNYTRATECLKGYTGIKKGQWTNYNGINIDKINSYMVKDIA